MRIVRRITVTTALVAGLALTGCSALDGTTEEATSSDASRSSAATAEPSAASSATSTW